MIALVDYGAGNLTSVRKGFAAVGVELVAPSNPGDLAGCAGIVVPGVGHFGTTVALSGGWREAIARRVEAGVPLFGICLGMQWLFDGSDEAPGAAGLGAIPGRCERLRADRPLKVPHVGWNALAMRGHADILAGLDTGVQVYFTHAYAAPVTGACVAHTTHGATFAAALEHGHISGVQFHPEKSGDAGLRILRNFAAIVRAA